MKYKLIRTDSLVNTEIDLICGIQSFGRNNFLDCDDKRVSRSHGQIEISHSGDIDLKALHLNPCFIKKKESTEVIILNQGDVARIYRDDQFGLLPSLYWYKVMECSDPGVEYANLPHKVVTTTELGTSEQNASKIPDIVIKKEVVDETDNFVLLSAVLDSEKKGITSNNLMISRMKRSYSTEDRKDEETTVSPKLRRLSVGHSSTATTCGEINNFTVKQEPLSPKKEIKEESCSVNAEPVNQPPVNNAPQLPVVQAPAVLPIAVIRAMKRERCYYGSNCYRKNLLHKQQFSHPTDPDWGTDEMIPCPYGRLCRKLDQRHFRDHSHPPYIILDDNLNQDDSGEDEYHDGLDIGSDASVDIDYDF